MSMVIINTFIYPLATTIILLSVFGYGKVINNFFYKDLLDYQLRNLILFQGLIFIGLFSIIVNIFYPLKDVYSICIIIIGLFFYLINFAKINLKEEINFISIVAIFSSFLAIYAGVNDDFDYHLKIINNYKNYNLFEIIPGRQVSYNSFWLFLHSVFSIDKYKASLFILGSLIFTITIYDLFFVLKKSFKANKFILSTISFFFLIFLLGIQNKFKDFGTDLPGAIISFYILFIIVNEFFYKKEISNNILIFLILLSSFVFVIKLTNVLILIFLIIYIFKINLFSINFKNIYFPILLILLWFFQNLIISGCLIWPIETTCFYNVENPAIEFALIESFAKGDLIGAMKTDNIEWIGVWFNAHSKKIFESYALFFLISISPLIINFFIKDKYIKNNNILEIYLYKFRYYELLIVIIISNLVWFFNAPAYRFGLFYNSILIIFVSMPLWLNIFSKNKELVYKYFRFLIILIFIYFTYENIFKIKWYFDRYEIWPPIINGELINRI